MGNELDFEETDQPISKALFQDEKFRIPRYQRPYSWTEDQITDFWSDLINNTNDSYFLGSFIFNYEDQRSGYIDVIDGQQRILTITILMAALRDIAKGIQKEFADLIQRKDLIVEDHDGNVNIRILCGDSTREYFEKYIQHDKHNILESNPKSKEEKRIKSNYEFFHNKILTDLEKFEANQRKIEYLKDIRSRVSKLIIIQIKIQSEEDAYEIFETTNARGVDLNVADLLKNLIFKNIKQSSEKDTAKEIWQEIVNNVQATNTEMNKFIRYYWISKYSFVTEKKLFKAIKKEISNWQELLIDLLTTSEWYNLLFVGDELDWKNKGINDYSKIYKSLRAINIMGVTQCFVLFLSILRNYKKLGTNPERIFRLVEKFTYVYSAICKNPGNVVEKIYSRSALKIEETIKLENEKRISGKIQQIFGEIERDVKDEKPSIEAFKEGFKDVKYKKSDIGRIFIKYILSEVNSTLEKTKEHLIDFNNVNVEHLIPQNPSSEWGLKKAEINEYVDQIGNLTLLDKRLNSIAGNKPLTEKMVELEKSDLPLNKELLEFIKKNNTVWNKKLINERQNQFSELAYNKIWYF